MQSIVFSLTAEAIRTRTKTVTRRFGWRDLTPGTLLAAVHREHIPGRRPPAPMAVLRVLSVRVERLSEVEAVDVAAEGFPGRSRAWFVANFTAAMRCVSTALVTRIEFEYLDAPTLAELDRAGALPPGFHLAPPPPPPGLPF